MKKGQILLFVFLASFVAAYGGGYLLVRKTHLLVHATDTIGRGGSSIEWSNAIIPAGSVGDGPPATSAMACWYIFYPLHKVETVLWRKKVISR